MIRKETRHTIKSPAGRVRISAAAIDKVVLASVQDAPGVTDVHGLIMGSFIGTVSGAIIGFVEAGPVGAALGAAAGGAAGAAAGEYIASHNDRRELFDVETDSPSVTVRLSAEYDANLEEVAEAVRANVLERVKATLGIDLRQVDVEVVDIGG
jgi:uncharacterized alkaline shock family protein YloU